MTATLNVIAALLTIGFGLFGFLAPAFTANALDLAPTKSTMGLSEMRASVGGLFVVTGAAVLWLNTPMAYAMLGVVYAGAALGRFVSVFLDNPPMTKALTFGGIELALAIWLIFANISKTP
ncbi:protein of unknown function [Ruegeria halocynthiae]|uniref:DUF4345 domain-containing protein n=1 Tax=Ruegeria halocynthiae TaxID=985054 RepID=A0A1H2TKE9_9RHOB|nr:DUF4345 family protein [Ruegeria halocynthiae]SDW44433.1 protein of unknown function [Ruegeria halocynthiae]